MEISVGFADKDFAYYKENGYQQDETVLGAVFILTDKIDITGDIRIRYEKHPWIEHFEVDGIIPKPVKRVGFGDRSLKDFVPYLNNIYSDAFKDYDNCKSSIEYFKKVSKSFIDNFDNDNPKMFRKFCGFVENLWREGDREIHDIAMNTVVPMIRENDELWNIFCDVITKEFLSEIKKL